MVISNKKFIRWRYILKPIYFPNMQFIYFRFVWLDLDADKLYQEKGLNKDCLKVWFFFLLKHNVIIHSTQLVKKLNGLSLNLPPVCFLKNTEEPISKLWKFRQLSSLLFLEVKETPRSPKCRIPQRCQPLRSRALNSKMPRSLEEHLVRHILNLFFSCDIQHKIPQ